MLEELRALAIESKDAGLTVAFGEIGLDYERLFLSPKEPQLKYFEAQLDLAIEMQMPLFLHSRAAGEDFERLLGSRLSKLPKGGLVHSFTGTMEEMQRLVALGLDIGVNGCSMKTEENLEVVKAIPLDRIQIETDGPWVRTPSSPFWYLRLTIISVKSALRMLRQSSWGEPRNCRRPSRRTSGRRAAWSKVGTSPLPLLVLPTLLLRSKASPSRRFAKRKSRGCREVSNVQFPLTFVIRAWNNSVRMFGLGEQPL